MRYAFAGDRQISVNLLEFLISEGHKPLALMVADGKNGTHSTDLMAVSNLDDNLVFKGNEFKTEENLNKLKDLELDYIFGIHFPYIVPETVLVLPKVGVINLHPSFLPYNKGWHTPSWAILEKEPYGATLHFMSKALDEGDIINQKRLEVNESDTANTLYIRVLKLEEKVFKESLPDLVSLKPSRTSQINNGTSHTRKELKTMQEIDINEKINAGVFIDKLRALTTNDINEAVFYKIEGKKFAIQVHIEELI